MRPCASVGVQSKLEKQEACMKELPRNVAAPEALGKWRNEGEVAHRRIEVTVEREVVTSFLCSAPEHSISEGHCSHCGRLIPKLEQSPGKQEP
jgi:hypothetical protein